MIRKALLMTVCGVALLHAGCAPAPRDLTGTAWELDPESSHATASGLGRTRVTLTFKEDGAITGAHAYLGYAGSYTADGDSLAISELRWTGLVCQAETGLAVQQSYLDALASARSYSVAGNRLTVATEHGELVFERVTADR